MAAEAEVRLGRSPRARVSAPCRGYLAFLHLLVVVMADDAQEEELMDKLFGSDDDDADADEAGAGEQVQR